MGLPTDTTAYNRGTRIDEPWNRLITLSGNFINILPSKVEVKDPKSQTILEKMLSRWDNVPVHKPSFEPNVYSHLTELLHYLSAPIIPAHNIVLKEDVPIMLLPTKMCPWSYRMFRCWNRYHVTLTPIPKRFLFQYKLR